MDYKDYLHEYCREKVITAVKAVTKIKNGSRVFVSTGSGEPQHLIRAMVNNASLQDVLIYQMLSGTLAEYVDNPFFLKRFQLKLFFISSRMRKAAFEGKIDYIPAYLSQIPFLFRSRRIGLDVALVQVTPPDRFGYCSMGVSVDITRSAVESARLVIAQVNPKMPRTLGNTFLHVDDVDFLVLQEEPVMENTARIADNAVSHRIGHYVSQLVNDGATIQVGFGQLPHSILGHLENKNDLGVHTQMISDAFLPLFEKGVITNRKKTLHPGRTVASLVMGSRAIFDYVNENPSFYFRSSEYVNNPVNIARNRDLISISSALEVDLTGQVCTDSLGYLFYSGIGDQVDFIRGSAMSEGGYSIIALPSTAQGGKVSRIVTHLSEGAGVATTRGDVHYVVTEYGIAELAGKSIYQRVMELAQIAHPKFREDLIAAAKTRHYIFGDQLPPVEDDLIFLESYKSCMDLGDGTAIEFRPLLPSDELSYRNFFYSLQDDTLYSRFFHYQRLFTHERVQEQVANVDYRKNMTLVGLKPMGGYKEIMAIGSYAMAYDSRAEVAFVVHEDYQGKGVGSYLLDALTKIAKENGYKGFVANVLKDNTGMIHVFRKSFPNAVVENYGGEVEILMDFDEIGPVAADSQVTAN